MQGPVERNIIETCIRDGLPLPKKIAEAPVLLPGLGLFYTAFTALSSCRQVGFGLGEIPWNVISEYCDRNWITGEQRDDTFYFVRCLDNEYIKFKSNEADKGSQKNAKSK